MSFIFNFIINKKLDYLVFTFLFAMQQIVVFDIFISRKLNVITVWLLFFLTFILRYKFIKKAQGYKNNFYLKELIHKYKKIIVIFFIILYIFVASTTEYDTPPWTLALMALVQFITYVIPSDFNFNPYGFIECILIFALLSASLFVYLY